MEYIKHITSFSEAKDILDTANADTLVVFDVDATLIIPCDMIFQPRHYRAYSYLLIDAFKARAGERFDYLWSKTYVHVKRVLNEPMISQIIASLQARNVKVLACTLLCVGPYGIVPLLEELRFKQLEALGIDFRCSFNQDIVFKTCPPYNNRYPMCYKGIVLTNNCTKSQVLGALLDYIQYIPKQVIFFDDVLDNVESVGQEMARRGIIFYGYHYTGAENIQGEFNPAIAQFQLNYLYEHEQWLSDAEAADKLYLNK